MGAASFFLQANRMQIRNRLESKCFALFILKKVVCAVKHIINYGLALLNSNLTN
jgi:hypothetical protein